MKCDRPIYENIKRDGITQCDGITESVTQLQTDVTERETSGKMTIRESSFRETSCPGKKLSGKRLSGKRLSGKVTIRESYYPGNDCKPLRW